MDDLTLDTNLPSVPELPKRVFAFSDNVRRRGVNANLERASLDNFDAANLVISMPCERSLHRVEVSVGDFGWTRNARPSLRGSLWLCHVCPATLAHDLPCAADPSDEILTAG